MMKLPLYPYQDPAVDRFLELGSLLVAYEMGLGKTPIAIACAEELLGRDRINTALLVVPASLRYQWAKALAKFTDLPVSTVKVAGEQITVPSEPWCMIVTGNAAARKETLRRARELESEYVIVSYETVVSDTRALRKLRPGLVVLDEASAIKTFSATRTTRIKNSLSAPYRLALTGTPVENRPEEAFSIMEWVNPDVLGSFDLFERAYIDRNPNGTVRRVKNLQLLNRRLSRAMVRRSRKDPDVAPYLPQVDHAQWHVTLDKDTRAVYDTMAADLLQALLAARGGGGGFDLAGYYAGRKPSGFERTPLGKVMSRHQAMELLLDHPSLVQTSARRHAESESAASQGVVRKQWPGSQYCRDFTEAGFLEGARTPKMDFLMTKLDEILAFPENKVIVFSQWPEILDLIAERLRVPAVLYHGDMSPAKRAAAIERFSRPEYPVFLSSHAGAYGTDMYMVNYLINYDLPWSGGTWDQLNARHQRASSEFGQVYVRDLIVSDTVEERKLALLRYKLRVAGAMVDGNGPRDGRIDNDVESLTDFLQRRA